MACLVHLRRAIPIFLPKVLTLSLDLIHFVESQQEMYGMASSLKKFSRYQVCLQHDENIKGTASEEENQKANKLKMFLSLRVLE